MWLGVLAISNMATIAAADRTLEQWGILLRHLATAYDDAQGQKRGHSIFALGHYFTGISAALAEPDFLKNPKAALAEHFLIRQETGGIGYRNVPADLSEKKFVLSFLNKKVLWV